MNWNYDENDVIIGDGYELIPPGKYRVRIDQAEETVSKGGKDMLKLTLSVSGYRSKIWDYIVFDNSSPNARQLTNTKLKAIFDSFNIPKTDSNNPAVWAGKVGAAQIKHEMYNGEKNAKIHYYLRRETQSTLPPWNDVSGVPAPDGVAVSASPNTPPFDPNALI